MGQSIGIGHFWPQMYRYRIGSEKVVSVHHYLPLGYRSLPIDFIQLKAAVSSFLFKWKEKGFMPSILNIVCYNGLSSLINEVLELWPASNSSLPSGHTAYGNLHLYSDLKAPLDLFPALLVLQLHFDQGAKAPCVYASKLGLVGLKNDLMILSNCNHGGNIAYKVGLWKGGNNINGHQFNITSISLKSVTDCNFSSSVKFDHSDLDQLAVACPITFRGLTYHPLIV